MGLQNFRKRDKTWKDKMHFLNMFMQCLFAGEYFPSANRDYWTNNLSKLLDKYFWYYPKTKTNKVLWESWDTEPGSNPDSTANQLCVFRQISSSEPQFLHWVKGNNNTTSVSGLLWVSSNIHQMARVVSGITVESLFFFSEFLKFSTMNIYCLCN